TRGQWRRQGEAGTEESVLWRSLRYDHRSVRPHVDDCHARRRRGAGRIAATYAGSDEGGAAQLRLTLVSSISQAGPREAGPAAPRPTVSRVSDPPRSDHPT